jgi:hypothetical protein
LPDSIVKVRIQLCINTTLLNQKKPGLIESLPEISNVETGSEDSKDKPDPSN